MTRPALLALAAALGGCGVYLHDTDRYASALEATRLVDEAARRSDRAWEATARGLEELEPAERAAIEGAVGRLGEADRRRIYDWDWARLKEEARRALAADAPLAGRLAHELGALRLRAQEARDSLLLVVLPQLAMGEAWPDDEAPLRRALEAAGIALAVETIRQELGGVWPDPHDAAGLATLLERLGIPPAEQKDPAAAGDRLLAAVEAFEDTLSRMRLVARAALEETWPLDEAIRLSRQGDHLDLFFGRPYDADETLPAELQARLARVGRIVERRPVEWEVRTPAQLVARLAPFDLRGEMIGRRFQRDVLSTRLELLGVELETLGRRAEALAGRMAALRERGEAAGRIVDFVDGPLGQIRLGMRAAGPDDSVFLTVRAQVDRARVQAAGFERLPAAAGDGVQFMKDYTAQVADAARAVEAAASYVRLEGELVVRMRLAEEEAVRAEHAGAVERARVAALGWRRLLDDGAQGLEAYWGAGLKGEELAKLIFLAGEMVSSTYTALR
jgi:hypothetical protein